MPYFVFDLDETLGNMYTPFYFLCDLRREDMVAGMPPTSETLRPYLDKAYALFVEKVLQKEASISPLGILRSNILGVMRILNTFKESGSIDGVVIYSNNGSLGALHFARDLIHAYIGNTNLICECIHWGHPARGPERGRTPGSALKTWNILKAILTNPDGPCKAPETLEPKDVYFIDDIIHPNLIGTLPKGHYIRVPPYEYKTPYTFVSSLYVEALKESGLLDNPQALEEYFQHVNQGCLKSKMTSIEDIVKGYKAASRTSPINTPPPGPDAGIRAIVDVIQSIKDATGGGKHRRVYKKHQQSRRHKHGRRHTRKTVR
jgi:hypothetical protein